MVHCPPRFLHRPLPFWQSAAQCEDDVDCSFNSDRLVFSR